MALDFRLTKRVKVFSLLLFCLGQNELWAENHDLGISQPRIARQKQHLRNLANRLGAKSSTTEKQNALAEISNLAAIDKYRDISIAPSVRTMLDGSDSATQAQAVQILGNLKDISSYKKIESMALKNQDKSVRLSSIWAMGKIDSRQADPVLTELMKDRDALIALQASAARGGLRPKEAYAFALNKLKDADSDVKTAAVAVIGELGNDASLKTLYGLLDDPSVQKAILFEAILKIHMRSLASDSEKIAVLKDALSHPKPQMREAAAWLFTGFAANDEAMHLIYDTALNVQHPASGVAKSVSATLGLISTGNSYAK